MPTHSLQGNHMQQSHTKWSLGNTHLCLENTQCSLLVLHNVIFVAWKGKQNLSHAYHNSVPSQCMIFSTKHFTGLQSDHMSDNRLCCKQYCSSGNNPSGKYSNYLLHTGSAPDHVRGKPSLCPWHMSGPVITAVRQQHHTKTSVEALELADTLIRKCMTRNKLVCACLQKPPPLPSPSLPPLSPFSVQILFCAASLERIQTLGEVTLRGIWIWGQQTSGDLRPCILLRWSQRYRRIHTNPGDGAGRCWQKVDWQTDFQQFSSLCFVSIISRTGRNFSPNILVTRSVERKWKTIILKIIIIITIMITLRGAIRDFLQSPHCAANCLNMYAQVAKVQSCAKHVQHI